MNEILKKLKIDKFNIIFYLGIILLFLSIHYKDIEFLHNKDLFGLSIGLIIIGLPLILGYEKNTFPTIRGIFTQEGSYLGWFLKIVLMLGLVLSFIFLYRILYQIL